ncbi:MAG: CPBP family intramembrane glutamic endopeptidase [Pyrinomonadaceae bacterium]
MWLRRDEAAREFAAWEIISVTLSLLLLIWVVLPLSGNSKSVGAAFIAVCFAFMLASHRLHGETRREIGWRCDNFLAAMGWVVLLICFFAIPLTIGAWLLVSGSDASISETGKLFGDGEIDLSNGAQLFWQLAMIFSGLAQQYLMQGFINRRAQIVFGRGPVSVLVVGLIFTLLHLPNKWLMLAAFVEGLGWAFIFQRVPNLFALAVSHAVMTRLIIILIPDHFLQGLRIGYRFFN